MKFGMNLLNFGPQASPRTLSEWALGAEALGFDAVFVSDHLVLTDDVAAKYPPPFFDPFVTAGWLLGVCERIQVGTSVTILPYRNPHHTARMSQNLSELGGRPLLLGVGAGWSAPEFSALGLDIRDRGRLTDASLQAMRDAWSRPTTTLGTGGIRAHTDGPAPEELRPRIWVGGSSAAALRRAARYGDAWHPIYPRVDMLQAAMEETLPALAAEYGREVPALAPRIRLDVTSLPVVADDRRLGEGTIEQIREDLLALAHIDPEWIVFDTYAGWPAQRNDFEKDFEHVRTLAEQLIDLERGTIRSH